VSIYRYYDLQCNCGTTFTAQLANGLNAGRSPEARRLILEGKFHRVECPCCRVQTTVEKQFFYIDFERNTFIRVNPRHDRHRWKMESEAIEKNLSLVPDTLSSPDDRLTRVVFGMAELREKLVAQDAKLDDRIVELLKVLALYEHPFLMQTPRLRILLDKYEADWLEFVACFDHDSRSFRIKFPRDIVESLLAKEDELRAWVAESHPDSNIFELESDYWINTWRWSPQPTALDRLRYFAAQLKAGEEIDTASPDFTFMFENENLPRGSHLPFWAKQDLRTIFRYAEQKGLDELQAVLLEIRFDKLLSDDWARNSDRRDIVTIWRLLENLPETNVEGNTFIHEIFLNPGSGFSWYSPESHDIYIGENHLPFMERFEDLVRHEVGHGVYEKFEAQIDEWLTNSFGWQMFESDDAGIDQWIALMGGWGSLTETQKAYIREHLRTALKSSVPAPAADDDPWHDSEYGPRKAYEKTGDTWYRQSDQWHTHGTKSFFLNFHYERLTVVETETLKLVGKMPRDYAAMSPFEFFAELYALYFDLDDPLRANIPDPVMQWLKDNVSLTNLNAAASRASSRPPSDLDHIIRPGEAREA
jgi:CpXC protein